MPQPQRLRFVLWLLLSLLPLGATFPQTVSPTLLVAGYNGGNDQDGIMFDVRATSQLTIRRFDINLQPQTDTVQIYTRPGSHVGAENSAMGWTLLGATTVTATASYVPTSIPIALSTVMQPGETRAFYITTVTPGVPDVIYTDTNNGVPGQTVVAAANGLTLLSGTGKAYPFGTNFTPRSFNGTIYYDVVIPQVPTVAGGALAILIALMGLIASVLMRARTARSAASTLVIALVMLMGGWSRASDAACQFNYGGMPQATYLVDGLILSRYAEGITGTAMLAGSGSARDPAVVAGEIYANIRSLDIDGNNAFDLADAAIIARYLAGFRGEALVASALNTPPAPSYGVGATRTTGAQIEAYLNGGCVPPPPVPPSGCVVTGASSVAIGASASYTVACAVGSFPFSVSWTRSAAGGTSPAGSGIVVSTTPFPVNGPDASATLIATVSNSAGTSTGTINVANASLDTISSSTASLASGAPSSTRQLQINVNKSGVCYSGEVLTVWVNGAQAYSGPYVTPVTLPIQSSGDYRIESRLSCAVPLSNTNATSTTTLNVPDNAFTSPNAADVEDWNAPLATGTAIGTLAGSASVNPSGAATYTVPLTLPPGTAGMQPALSLAFSSQSGRGILGTGWNLSGFSLIHRCPATMEIDGFKGTVDARPYPNQDRFCLDGMRLVSLGGLDGANGTEYRTERDSYARITSYVDVPGYGVTRWIVETKSGQTLTFGVPLYRGSTGDANAAVDPLRTKAWGLSEAKDTVGNTMTYSYEVNHLNGWLLPKSIAYTSNPNTGLAPYASVDMSYDYSAKPDTSVVYDGTGAYGVVPPLLTSITTRVDGAVAHRYNMGYESSPTTGRVRLTGIEQCGGGLNSADGLCVAPTRFTYNNATVDTNQPWLDVGSVGFGINPSRGEGMLPLDLTGTGKTQLLRSNTFSGYSFSGFGGGGVTLNITNASDALAQQLGTTNCVRDANIAPVCQTDVSMDPVLGDFNGDGYTDLITTVQLGYGGDSRNRYMVCLARPSSPLAMDCEVKLSWGDHDNYQSLEVLNGLGDGNYSFSPLTPKILVGDFDGDGKSDVLDLTSGTLFFDYTVGGYGKRRPVVIDGLVLSNPDLVRKLAVSDFNGDGRMDIAANSETASWSAPLAAQGFNRWVSFLSEMRTTDGPSSDGTLATRRNSVVDGPNKRDQQPHIADVNGDGLADMVAFYGAPAAWLADTSQSLDPYLDQFQWQVCLSKGDGQFDCSMWFGPPSGELPFQNKKYPVEVLGDFNGDGRTDLAIADLDGSYDFDTNSSVDGPKRWLICVATPSQNPASPRGRFDCGSGVPQSTISTLSAGGWWANGIRRAGLTRYNPTTGERTYGFDIVAQGDFAGNGRTGLAGGTPRFGLPRITVPNVVDPVATIPDMLASVTNGLGFTQRFKYKPITDSTVYQKAQDNPAYPVLNVQTAMFVVREMSQDDGLNTGGELRTTYTYRGLKGHVRGGGSLGFESITARDEQTGFTTETRFDNSYPARGLISGVTKRQGDGRLLGRSTTGYRLLRPYTTSAVAQQVHSYLPLYATEEAWDIDGSALPVTVTQSTYGSFGSTGNVNAGDLNAAFGCATNVVAATYAPGTDPNGAGWSAGTPPSGITALFKKAAVNTYDNGLGGWRFCRLRSVTATSEQTAYPAETVSETRTSTFRYNLSTGLLDQEVIQPSTASDEASLAAMLTTTYTHDAYGNRVQADVTGWNGTTSETRSSFSTYDNRGRFATGSRNALGHTGSRSFNPTLGTLQSETGSNGLTTTYKYDRLGRKVTEIRADGTKTSVRYSNVPNAWGGLNVLTLATGGAQTSGDTDRLGREVRRGVLIAHQGGSSTATRWSFASTSYDARGRVSGVTRPYFAGDASLTPCSRGYDNLDRVTSESCAQDSGNPATTTQNTYAGLKTTVTITAADATGASSTRTSQSTLDARGQALQTINTQGSSVQHAYDAAGNLTRTTRSVGSERMATAIAYDLRGRKKTLSDPDTGSYRYRYNAFGELIEQIDGKAQSTTMRYDALGRPTQRISGVDLQSNYAYDTCYQGIGKLCSASASGIASPSGAVGVEGYRRTLTYDALGRPITETSVIGSASAGTYGTQFTAGAAPQRSYTSQTSYDEAGRVKQIRYPNGQWVTRQYDTTGAWNKLVGSAGQTLWQGGTVDAEARLQNWTLGNGLTGAASFGPNTGRLATLTTSSAAQSLSLAYDGFGNIKSRLDAANGYQQANGTAETFRYDTLNQLTQANFLEGAQNIAYDGFGRIVTKTGVNGVAGNYQYKTSTANQSSTSHQVQTAGGRNYSYDGNGNVDTITGTAAGSITLSWTTFNQALTLPVAASTASTSNAANAVIQLRYGADQERRVEMLPVDVSVTGGNQTALRYVLNAGSALFYEEDIRADGSKEQRAYLTAPTGVIAVHTTNTDANGNPAIPTGAQANAQNLNPINSASGALQPSPYTLTYWIKDHLGSVTVTTDERGTVKERMRFDPWGKPMTSLGSKARTGDRGFTEHEHLAGGLIHMNGRIYDPVLGRFLSADVIVQFPDAITSYNRYGYVMNNPLGFTDPSGYFIETIITFLVTYGGVTQATATFMAYASVAAASAAAVAAATGHQTAARKFVGAALMFFSGGTPWGGFAAFAAGGIQSGSLEGAVVAGVMYGAGQVVGPILSDAITKIAAAFDLISPQTIAGYRIGEMYASADLHVLDRVDIVGSRVSDAVVTSRSLQVIDTQIYQVTHGTFGAAAVLASGATKTEGVSISAKRYSPAANEMLEFMKWGTPFGSLLSCASGYEDCSGFGWGLAVASAVPGGGAARGLGWQNPLYKAATQPFKDTTLSNAGRALTKHPELIGQTKEGLRQVLRSDIAINQAAHHELANIIRNGTVSNPTLGRYGAVTQIQLPGGFGARWGSDGRFIGFINP